MSGVLASRAGALDGVPEVNQLSRGDLRLTLEGPQAPLGHEQTGHELTHLEGRETAAPRDHEGDVVVERTTLLGRIPVERARAALELVVQATRLASVVAQPLGEAIDAGGVKRHGAQLLDHGTARTGGLESSPVAANPPSQLLVVRSTQARYVEELLDANAAHHEVFTHRNRVVAGGEAPRDRRVHGAMGRGHLLAQLDLAFAGERCRPPEVADECAEGIARGGQCFGLGLSGLHRSASGLVGNERSQRMSWCISSGLPLRAIVSRR